MFKRSTNYFDNTTKLFSYLHLAKFLGISIKPFFRSNNKIEAVLNYSHLDNNSEYYYKIFRCLLELELEEDK